MIVNRFKNMEKETIEKIKLSLDEIKIKQIQLNKEKNKKGKSLLDAIITHLKNNLISNFNLMEYDLYIKSDSHNTDFFIHDIEMLIIKHQNENEKQN